ncbi:MAG: hypothetical protein WCT03_16210 [Candidatus Obscuribacterales bacterium]
MSSSLLVASLVIGALGCEAQVATAKVSINTNTSTNTNTQANTNTQSNTSAPVSAPSVLPESDFKSDIRDLHENLRRIEGALHDIDREAGRRQVIANSLINNDAFIADPWVSCMACGLPSMMADSTRLGAFLKPRASFLKLSLSSLDSLSAAVHTLLVNFGRDTEITNNTKAKVDLDVLSDALKNFDAQLVSLKALCNVESPDNAQILMAVGTLKQTVDGIDTVGGRLWKAAKTK